MDNLVPRRPPLDGTEPKVERRVNGGGLRRGPYVDRDLRNDGCRLGAARRFRPAPARAARPRQGEARRLGDGRAPLLRHDQRPLHHQHAYRHLGAGQGVPLDPAAAGRRTDPLGFRLGREAPRALQPVDGRRRAVPRRHSAPARRDDAQHDARRGNRRQDRARAGEAWPEERAGGRRHRRAADDVRAAGARRECRRRPVADAGRARHQDPRRDQPARPFRRHGRRGL